MKTMTSHSAGRSLFAILAVALFSLGFAADAASPRSKSKGRRTSAKTTLPVKTVRDEKGTFKVVKIVKNHNTLNCMVPVSFIGAESPDVKEVNFELMMRAFGKNGSFESLARTYISKKITRSIELWGRGVSISPYSISDEIMQFRVETTYISGNSDHEEQYCLILWNHLPEDGERDVTIWRGGEEDFSAILQKINVQFEKLKAELDWSDESVKAKAVSEFQLFEKDGVRFHYPVGEIGGWHSGPFDIVVPYSELKEYMNPEVYEAVTNPTNQKFYPELKSYLETNQ